MKFLGWFRRGKPVTGVAITSQIVVNTEPPRTDLPEFCVEGGGEIINLWPFAAEVLNDYPDPIDIDADTLARLAVKGHNGRYIKVAEFPPGVDRKAVSSLIGRVARWADWPRRLTQLQKNDGGAFPSRRFVCDEGACEMARKLHGEIIPVSDLMRLPLNGCWSHGCRCDFRLVRRDGRVV